MVFLTSLSAVNRIVEGVGGMDSRVGWDGLGGGKNNHLRHSMSSHDAHTVANDNI